jgi:hypothetical protein
MLWMSHIGGCFQVACTSVHLRHSEIVVLNKILNVGNNKILYIYRREREVVLPCVYCVVL